MRPAGDSSSLMAFRHWHAHSNTRSREGKTASGYMRDSPLSVISVSGRTSWPGAGACSGKGTDLEAYCPRDSVYQITARLSLSLLICKMGIPPCSFSEELLLICSFPNLSSNVLREYTQMLGVPHTGGREGELFSILHTGWFWQSFFFLSNDQGSMSFTKSQS